MDLNDEKPILANSKEDNKYYSDHIYCLDNSPTTPILITSTFEIAEPSTTATVDSRFLFKEIQQLKNMLLLNLDLVQEQSEKLNIKNQEIERLNSENEMLKSKLERETRRKSSKNKNLYNTDSKSKNRFILVKPQNVEKNELDNNRNDIRNPNETSPIDGDSAPPVNTVQKIVLQRVRTLKGDMNAKIISPSKDEELPPPSVMELKEVKKKDIYVFDSNSNDDCFQPQSPVPKIMYMSTPKTYLTSNWRDLINEKLENIALIAEKNLEIPSWTTKEISSCYSIEGTENMSDDVFLKRHAKFEIDEKRRKKWDLMRIREQKTIERLKKRHEGFVAESSSGGDNITTSFYPSSDNVRFIQISEEVPVQAFGDAIPAIPAKEFTLPWSVKQSTVHNENLLVQRTKYICRKNIYPTLVKRKYGKPDSKKQ